MKWNKPKLASQIPTMEPEFVPKLQQQDQHDCPSFILYWCKLCTVCYYRGENFSIMSTKDYKDYPDSVYFSLKIASRMSQLLKTWETQIS